MITNQPHTPEPTMNNDTDTSTDHTDEQLTLEGFADPLAGIDPRFILSDETCRIGRKYLAEMRRILANGRVLAAQNDGRAQAA
jgi:citrate lyase synthetase